MEVIKIRDNIKAENVASLAKIFGVNFTQEDINTLQDWINEEKEEEKENKGE